MTGQDDYRLLVNTPSPKHTRTQTGQVIHKPMVIELLHEQVNRGLDRTNIVVHINLCMN